jgi:hypothetical protein
MNTHSGNCGKRVENFSRFCPITESWRVFEFWELWITSGKTFFFSPVGRIFQSGRPDNSLLSNSVGKEFFFFPSASSRSFQKMAKRKTTGIHPCRQYLARLGASPELSSPTQNAFLKPTTKTRGPYAISTCGHCGDPDHQMPKCIDLFWPGRWRELPNAMEKKC